MHIGAQVWSGCMCTTCKCEWAARHDCSCGSEEWPACDGCLLSAVDTSLPLCAFGVAHIWIWPTCLFVSLCGFLHVCVFVSSWRGSCMMAGSLHAPVPPQMTFEVFLHTCKHKKKDEKGERTRTDTHRPVACHQAAMLWNRHSVHPSSSRHLQLLI